MQRPVSGQASAEAARIEAAELIRLAAGPNVASETTKARIVRASNSLGWKRSRVTEIWWKRARRIESHEMDRLREFDDGS